LIKNIDKFSNINIQEYDEIEDINGMLEHVKNKFPCEDPLSSLVKIYQNHFVFPENDLVGMVKNGIIHVQSRIIITIQK